VSLFFVCCVEVKLETAWIYQMRVYICLKQHGYMCVQLDTYVYKPARISISKWIYVTVGVGIICYHIYIYVILVCKGRYIYFEDHIYDRVFLLELNCIKVCVANDVMFGMNHPYVLWKVH